MLPRDLANAIRAQAQRCGAESVSAFIVEVLAEKSGPVIREEKPEHDGLQDVLDEIFADHPMRDEERAWADQFLLAP